MHACVATLADKPCYYATQYEWSECHDKYETSGVLPAQAQPMIIKHLTITSMLNVGGIVLVE